jgi:hypothetical protein
MKLEQLEAEILALPKDTQATLLAKLLGHLGQIGEIDQGVASIWVEEAEQRDQSITSSQVTGIHAEEVFQRLRTFLQ